MTAAWLLATPLTQSKDQPELAAAVNTTTSCTPTPITESTVRMDRLRIAPRTARETVCGTVLDPGAGGHRRGRRRGVGARGAAMWLTRWGASSTPAIAPSQFHVVPVLAYSPDPGPVAVVNEA
ncbi:hypothetical protein MAHJHV60_47070 [Mycobacterium avium subsp. hominissuis]